MAAVNNRADRMTTAAHTLFAHPVDRLLRMEPGEIETFPAEEYWRVNARRTRAERRLRAEGRAGRFRLKRKGPHVFVLRVE